jgi:hypothetical protein
MGAVYLGDKGYQRSIFRRLLWLPFQREHSSQRISTDHPNILKKVKWTREKEGPSLHPPAPSLQIGPFTHRRTTAKGSSIVQQSG